MEILYYFKPFDKKKIIIARLIISYSFWRTHLGTISLTFFLLWLWKKNQEKPGYQKKSQENQAKQQNQRTLRTSDIQGH